MALARFQWSPDPPRVMILSTATASQPLRELPEIAAPVMERSDPELEANSPRANPLLTPLPSTLTPEIPHPLFSKPTAVGPSAFAPASATAAIASLAGEGWDAEIGGAKGGAARQKAVFFGLASGGATFCFVVDSSRSMRGGKFDAARWELIRAVSALQPSQKFFVLLFDQNVEAMELHPGEPATLPAAATAENKKRLANWLAKAKMEPSAKPEKAFEIALSLQVDAIFLLTDGELPEHLAELIREQNRPAGAKTSRTSQSGERPPIRSAGFSVGQSRMGAATQQRIVVNTIGLYSLRGQALLQRIARENGGAYRFIPRPARP